MTLEDELIQTKEGFWKATKCFHFSMKQSIQDVQEFGRLLKKYLKVKGLSFECKSSYLIYTDQRADKNCNPYFFRGDLVMEVRRKSLMSRLNPRHSKIDGDETIVIQWDKGDDFFITFQEYKYEESGKQITWKIPLEQIKAFKEKLERFAGADDIYKLLLDCATQDE